MDEILDMKSMTKHELEQMMDELIENMRDDIERDEQRVTILNTLRMKQMQFAYAALQYVMAGKNVVISHELYKPFKTMGSISVEGSLLEFDDSEWFSRIAEFATNVEVYPLKKNIVRMSFTFHGLTAPVE